MNNTEIVACIYKHAGRTDDLENLTKLAEEIARLAADEEREACAEICDVTRKCGPNGAGIAADKIRARSNVEAQGRPYAVHWSDQLGPTAEKTK